MTAPGPFDFAKYKRPQSEGPIHQLPHARAADSDDSEMPENFGDLLDQVSSNSAKGALGRQDRHDSAGIRLVTAASG
jgi:hypothetical protein